MKKILSMLIVLALIYIGIQLGFRFFGKGHLYEYQVVTNNNTFEVKEKFITNTKGEEDNYYFEINNNGTSFSYQTFASFGKADHIIKNIYLFEDNDLKCILPTFINDAVITDIMCKKNDITYFYQAIKGTNSGLDAFATSLEQNGYNQNNWIDNSVKEAEELVDIYKSNVLANHYLALANYKGVYTISNVNGNKINNIKLFNSDVYKRPMSIVFDKYYIVANYNEQYRFTKFYVVDLKSNKVKEINCEREISFDSYIQGTKNNSIYFFDRDSKIQYELNLKTEKVLEVGNESISIKVLRNGEWQKVSAISAKNNMELFDSIYKSDIENNNYVRIDKVGSKESGYYYFYKKDGNNYSVYRANVKNSEQLTYLFNTTEINRVNYSKEYIYYIDGNSIKYYSDKTGIKSLVIDNEFQYNSNILYGLYTK